MNRREVAALALFALCGAFSLRDTLAADDIVFADFESTDYGQWKVEGTAFGSGPARGTLPEQMVVTGFHGQCLVNSYHGGDDAKGRLISPPFTIEHRYIAFLIGGGGYEGKTCANLIVDGKVVRTATGPNTQAGGSERLTQSGWDVQKLHGKTAHIEIVDEAAGGWGHITMDEIVFTETKPPLAVPLRHEVSRSLTASGRWLNFPVRNTAPMRQMTIRTASGQIVRHFGIPLSDDGQPDWWASSDVGEWRDKPLTLTVDTLPKTSRALDSVTASDALAGHGTLYQESLRPQFHFSAQRGWLNDPNGLAYFNGEYHLFFQHTPFSWGGDKKYWGHAVSRDLVHWTEVEEALYPDTLGDIWSGSAAIDERNTSGFGKDGKAPLVLVYTAAGQPFTQCLAYITDGRQVTKFAGNPVLGNITNGNRDPRLFWHEPTKRWVIALYVEKDKRHTVHFFTSPNLKDWTLASVSEGIPNSNYLYECPDIFALPLDGDPKNLKWILTGADSQYTVGSFDGQRFVPETPPLPGQRGRGFYAAQTFNNAPGNRRVQIGWWQTETPKMPFNQSMSLPLELHLITTAEGPRLTWTPVPELASLRARTHSLGATTLTSDSPTNPLAGMGGELLEIQAEFAPEAGTKIAFQIRGVPVVYDSAKQELSVNGHVASAPLQKGKQRLTIFVDRTGLEVFASEGLTFIPMPINLKPEETSLSVTATGGAVMFTRLDVYELRSIWQQ